MAISRALALLLLATASAQAGETLSLTSAEGATVTLDQLRAGHDATVLVFWSATCPCVRRYQERVDALLDAYPKARLKVIAVSSNAGECFADALGAAKERGMRVPLYRDEGGRLAEAFGARSTPTVVLLDASGAMRFRGWIDNERQPGDSGREPWLDRAIVGLLEGKSFESRSPVYGCRITKSLRDPPPEAGSCCGGAAKTAGGAP
jgi:peroxiredoxin